MRVKKRFYCPDCRIAMDRRGVITTSDYDGNKEYYCKECRARVMIREKVEDFAFKEMADYLIDKGLEDKVK